MLANYLTTVTKERMGFSATETGADHSRRIAELLVTWRDLVWEIYEGRN
jgi:hypothetical protein